MKEKTTYKTVVDPETGEEIHRQGDGQETYRDSDRSTCNPSKRITPYGRSK